MKKGIIFIILLLSLVPLTFGATFKGDDELFLTEPIEDDLYVGAGALRIDERVGGDVFAGGGNVVLTGLVEGDATVGGGDVQIRGEIKDDLRVGGGNVLIEAKVGDDVLIGAGEVEIGSQSLIKGDLYVASGSIVINGPIEGKIVGNGQTIFINAPIQGDVTLYGIGNITFGSNGLIKGNLTYHRSDALPIPPDKVQGRVEHQRTSIKPMEDESIWTRMFQRISIGSILMTLFSGLILLWLFRYYLLGTTEAFHQKTLASLGWGVLLMIATPIVAFLMMIILIGLPLGFILFLALLASFYFGKLIACMGLGSWILKSHEKQSRIQLFGAFIVGVLIYTGLGLIPGAGPIIKLLLVLIGMGAMAMYEWELLLHLRKGKRI